MVVNSLNRVPWASQSLANLYVEFLEELALLQTQVVELVYMRMTHAASLRKYVSRLFAMCSVGVLIDQLSIDSLAGHSIYVTLVNIIIQQS